nr:hypothetical protein [Escherichia coli]
MVCRDQCQTCLPIMRQNACCLSENLLYRHIETGTSGRVAVKESNQRWCSDGFEFCRDNGERLRVTFALDCCDREALHWAVTTGGFNSETVQDVMLERWNAASATIFRRLQWRADG